MNKNKIKKILKSTESKKFALFSLLIILGFILGTNVGKIEKLSFSFLSQQIKVADRISAKELKEVLDNKDFTFINVHTPYDGEIGQTDMFLEHDSLMANKDKLPQDKTASIVLYCRSGNMSAQALNTLKDMGYTNVRHLAGGMKAWQKAGYEVLDLSKLPDEVIPEKGVELPVSWGNIGPELIRIGVIDLAEFEKVMNLTQEQEKILKEGSGAPIKITRENSRFVVNMLWALGLAQKSKVYDEGPMGTKYKDKAGNFASTGGWSLAKGDAVNYLNRYDLISLTSKQQDRVYEIADNVYRPCCGNNTAFPDCNHGMAALSAIELMVSAGISEEEIYKNLLTLNSYWFSDTYLTLATHFARQGILWSGVDAKSALGQEYSSSKGAGELYKKVGPLPYGGQAGGSCGA